MAACDEAIELGGQGVEAFGTDDLRQPAVQVRLGVLISKRLQRGQGASDDERDGMRRASAQKDIGQRRLAGVQAQAGRALQIRRQRQQQL